MASVLRVLFGVEKEYDAGHLAPVCVHGIRIEEPRVGEKMSFIIWRNSIWPGCNIDDGVGGLGQVVISPDGIRILRGAGDAATWTLAGIIIRSNKIREWHPLSNGHSEHIWPEYEEIPSRKGT